jgi:hypothetical protein
MIEQREYEVAYAIARGQTQKLSLSDCEEEVTKTLDLG